MEQSIPPWAFPASPRPATGTAAGASTHIGAGTSTGNPVLGDNGRESLEPSQQDLLLQEYNRCAEKHGLRPLLFGKLGVGDQDGLADQSDLGSLGSDRRNWFARTFGKPSMPSPRRSSRNSIGSRSERSSRHRRSDSDTDHTTLPQFVQALQASQGSHGSKSDTTDTLKNHTLETLVRICGKSYLYLPTEHATRSLMLPTCFRAAAQHLVQNGPEARGIFRISGSMRVVNELYDYYCINLDDDQDISATVRAPNLPFHIKCGVHDVASMFKRLLAGLPGGILGYLGLFVSLVDILKLDAEPNSGQMNAGEPLKDPRKARLIALAIGAVPSALQRELICAVFGLLSLIGSAAETEPAVPGPSTPGISLPHSEKMGFAALGIIFGPLLIGNHLSSYYLPESSSDSSFTPPPTASQPETPSPRSKAEKKRKSIASDRHASSLPTALDKIFLANDVAQMVVSNWQEAVSQMTQIGIMRKESMLQPTKQKRPDSLPRTLRPTKSDTFSSLNMGAMISQASHGYSSNLRKARSASNNRKPTGHPGQGQSGQSGQSGQAGPSEKSRTTSGGKLPTHNLPSQRPADMTFEEFAARKKLRSHASNISISSDSTYSAITPQPVRPLSPQSEDPFYVSDPKATSSRFGAARLTKQRRASGGISSLFSDKSTSSAKSSPKIPRKAVPSGEGQASQRKRSGKMASPWNVSLSPVKTKDAKDPADSDMGQKTKTRPLPTPTTPKHTRHQLMDMKACQSEPAGRIGVGGTPQSKTAALIAKIINTKPQETPPPPALATPTRKSKLVLVGKDEDAMLSGPSRNRRLAVSSDETGKTPLLTTRKLGNTDASLPELHRSAITSEKLEKSTAQPSPLQISRKQTKQPVTPQRNSVVSVSSCDDRAGIQSHKLLQTNAHAVDTNGTATTPAVHAPAPPLSEIKNDARGVARSQPNATSATPVTQIKAAQEEPQGKNGAKSPAIGSSVRAMAALFDGTPWTCSAESPAAGQAPTSRSQAPPKGPVLTEYTNNTPAPKASSFVTPTRPLSTHWRSALEENRTPQGDTASLQERASVRRQLRLSKSEDRSARLVKAHQHVTDENKDVARSVDQRAVVDVARRKHTSQSPLRSMRTKQLPDPESPSSRKTQAKSALSTRHSATPAIPHITGKLASLLPSSDEKTCAKRLQQLLDGKSIDCERWQMRAEAAERRVAELELLLSLSGVSDKADRPDRSDRSDSSAVFAGDDNRQSWAWQDLLPEPASIETREEKADTGYKVPSGERAVPQLRKENRRVLERSPRRGDGRSTDTDDGYASESSTTTVVVHGRLANERLMPFSM